VDLVVIDNLDNEDSMLVRSHHIINYRRQYQCGIIAKQHYVSFFLFLFWILIKNVILQHRRIPHSFAAV